MLRGYFVIAFIMKINWKKFTIPFLLPMNSYVLFLILFHWRFI